MLLHICLWVTSHVQYQQQRVYKLSRQFINHVKGLTVSLQQGQGGVRTLYGGGGERGGGGVLRSLYKVG